MEKNILRPQQQLPPKAEFKNKINKQKIGTLFFLGVWASL